MVQVIGPGTRKPSFGERLSQGVGRGLEMGSQLMQQHEMKQAVKQLGLDPSILKLPEQAQAEYFKNKFSEENLTNKRAQELQGNKKIISDLEQRRGLEAGSLSAYEDDPKMAEQISRPPKEPKEATTTKPVPKEISRSIKKVLADNPTANADELRIAMDEADIPPIYSNPYTENRRRTEEATTKTQEDKTRALRQETLPIRTQIANKAMAASQGIKNKEHLLELIEKGDINDPTYAALAESLPLNLGKRLLSNDTVEYKSGLIEEFGDLKNIFQGQTRVKELELLEQKIADLYLTDDQKRSILKSRINALKGDEIRAEVAQELENEPLGVLQFQQELEKRAKPKLEDLFNQILDEQKSIIQNAENRKQVPLDFNDPDDKKIIDQIYIEAGKNYKKAEELAKKKGYKW